MLSTAKTILKKGCRGAIAPLLSATFIAPSAQAWAQDHAPSQHQSPGAARLQTTVGQSHTALAPGTIAPAGDRSSQVSLLDWLITPASVLQELSPLVTSLFPQSPWHYPEQWAPQFSSFDSPRLDAQIRIYAAYLAEFGVPDVMIVGSSRALQGIDPATLQDSLAKQGASGIQVYNFSINGATAQVVDFVVRELLTPDQLPQLILWGGGSRAFNSLRTDRTFDQIRSSSGYAQLQSEERPIRYPFSRPIMNQVCTHALNGETAQDQYARSEEWPEIWSEERSEEAYSGFITPNDESQSPRHHHGIGSPIPAPPRINRRPEHRINRCDRRRQIWRELGISEAAVHDTSILQDEWMSKYGDGLTPLGFSVVTDTFDPSVYYQTFPRVPGAYDTNYVEFQLTGIQTQAVNRLVNYLNRQQVPIVFVNLPLTTDYLDAFRQERERRFSQYLTQLAQQPGFLLRDLNHPEFSQNAFFADPSHLNREGAEAIARHLAHDITLPWPNDPQER